MSLRYQKGAEQSGHYLSHRTIQKILMLTKNPVMGVSIEDIAMLVSKTYLEGVRNEV
jgi:hypothetical protein